MLIIWLQGIWLRCTATTTRRAAVGGVFLLPMTAGS